jgi:hypothetical protein
VHRFDVEHTLRFCKERLGWDRARVRTPEQMDRWTWTVLAAYTQLRLARGLIADCRLPWERPRPPDQLTPWRVLRGLANWCACWVHPPVHQNRAGAHRDVRKAPVPDLQPDSRP